MIINIIIKARLITLKTHLRGDDNFVCYNIMVAFWRLNVISYTRQFSQYTCTIHKQYFRLF